jgi:hypothetical protein
MRLSTPEQVAGLIVNDNAAEFTVASGKLFSFLIQSPSKDVEQIARTKSIQQSDVNVLSQ